MMIGTRTVIGRPTMAALPTFGRFLLLYTVAVVAQICCLGSWSQKPHKSPDSPYSPDSPHIDLVWTRRGTATSVYVVGRDLSELHRLKKSVQDHMPAAAHVSVDHSLGLFRSQLCWAAEGLQEALRKCFLRAETTCLFVNANGRITTNAISAAMSRLNRFLALRPMWRTIVLAAEKAQPLEDLPGFPFLTALEHAVPVVFAVHRTAIRAVFSSSRHCSATLTFPSGLAYFAREARTTVKPRVLVASKSCKARLQVSEVQREQIHELFGPHAVFFRFVGDDLLAPPYTLLADKELVTVAAKDDYLNLCHKFYLMMLFVSDYLDHMDPDGFIVGVLTTDEDIRFKPSFPRLVNNYASHPWWGWLAHAPAGPSWHFLGRLTDAGPLGRFLRETYPSLQRYGIWVDDTRYTAGGATWLRRDVIPHILDEHRLFLPFPESDEALTLHLRTTEGFGPHFMNVSAFQDLNMGAALHAHGVPLLPVDIWEGVERWERQINSRL